MLVRMLQFLNILRMFGLKSKGDNMMKRFKDFLREEKTEYKPLDRTKDNMVVIAGKFVDGVDSGELDIIFKNTSIGIGTKSGTKIDVNFKDGHTASFKSSKELIKHTMKIGDKLKGKTTITKTDVALAKQKLKSPHLFKG